MNLNKKMANKRSPLEQTDQICFEYGFDEANEAGGQTTIVYRYSTGAVRSDAGGKGRFDLTSPIAMQRLAEHNENALTTYEERNWEHGMPLHRYLDSTLRHINTWLLNRTLGKEQQEDHLIAAAWNLLALVHTLALIEEGELPVGLDDLPGGKKEG